MREHIKADEPFERTDVPVAEALERFRGEGQDYKVELIEDLVRDRGRRDRLALPQRPVHRPLPRPARPRHQAHQGVQAHQRRRRLLARRRRPPDAHAHLRHRLPLEGGPRGAPRAARAGPRARPPQARQGARPVHVLRAVARLAVLAAQRAWTSGTSSPSSGAARTPSAATARCARRSSTTSSSGSSPATGTSTATTCTSRTSRSGRWASSP